MKKKIICFMLIFFSIGFIQVNSCAKYVQDVEIDVANVELDRTEPELYFLDVYNVTTYTTSEGKRYDISIGMKVKEKKLVEDTIKKDKINVWVDHVKTEVEMEITETKHTEEEHIYKIDIRNLEGTGYLNIHFERGAVTDVARLGKFATYCRDKSSCLKVGYFVGNRV